MRLRRSVRVIMYNTGAGVNAKLYYTNFVNSSNIMGVYNVSIPHTFVRDTFNSFYEKVLVGMPY